MMEKIKYTPYNPQFKETRFPGEDWSYIAPSWEQMGQVYLDLGAKILMNNGVFDTLVTLAKGGWTWSRTIADILNIEELASFKLTVYDPSQPGKKLSEPVLETPLAIPLIGKRVLLFDDVDDTGETLIFSLKYLNNFGAASITTATLFHKPHSKFKPDFFGAETSAWVIFPHERREGLVGLARKWHNQGLDMKTIKDRLLGIGLPEKEIELFLSLENFS
jgi:hypoxanthine phosphoribosyltransferase